MLFLLLLFARSLSLFLICACICMQVNMQMNMWCFSSFLCKILLFYLCFIYIYIHTLIKPPNSNSLVIYVHRLKTEIKDIRFNRATNPGTDARFQRRAQPLAGIFAIVRVKLAQNLNFFVYALLSKVDSSRSIRYLK